MSLLEERLFDVEAGYAIQVGGLRVLRELSRSEWARLGQQLRARLEGHRWALGDWLAYGTGREEDLAAEVRIDRRGDARVRWVGSSYERAQEITGYSLPVLSAAYTTAKAFPFDSRDLSLVWSLYERIAQQPEPLRAELLRACKKHKWTTRDLEEHLQAGRAPRKPHPAPKGRRRSASLQRVRCPHCEHVFQVKGNIL